MASAENRLGVNKPSIGAPHQRTSVPTFINWTTTGLRLDYDQIRRLTVPLWGSTLRVNPRRGGIRRESIWINKPPETCKQRTFRTVNDRVAAASSTGAARGLGTLHDYDGSMLIKRHRWQLILLSTTSRGPYQTTPGLPGARSSRPGDLTHKECSATSHPLTLYDAGRSQRTLRVGLTATARRPELR